MFFHCLGKKKTKKTLKLRQCSIALWLSRFENSCFAPRHLPRVRCDSERWLSYFANCASCWVMCNETPQRLKTKGRIQSRRGVKSRLCALILYSLALYASRAALCLAAALITHQSGATNHQHCGRRWYTQSISGSLTGNHVGIGGNCLGDK